MVEKDDIESLLKTGSWRTARSRSPNSHDPQHRAYEPRKPNIGVPRPAELASRSKRPPPPCVEDEAESLAKEHIGSVESTTTDEDPKHRGEIDQQPLLLPVHEHNPERRFVVVPGAAVQDAPKTTQARYEANTCRKFVLVSPEKGAESGGSGKEDKKAEDDLTERAGRPEDTSGRPKERPDIQKRKSHQDLPRLNTEFEHPEPSIRRSSSRRDREKPVVHQEDQDYPSARDKSSARPPDSAFLSPAAGGHTSKRRDRAYSDTRRSGRSPSTRRDAEVEVSGRRRPQHSRKYPPAPALRRRASSSTNAADCDSLPAERPRSFIQPGYGDPDDIMAFMAPGVAFMQGRNTSPPRKARDSPSPPHPRGAREMPGSLPSRSRPPRSTAREQDGYSSDDSYKSRRPNRSERPYPERSVVEPDYPSMLSPDQARRPNPRLGAAVPPSAAAKPASIPDDPLQPSPRSSTFPADKSRRVGERSVSPPPAASTLSSRRPVREITSTQSKTHSRDASVGSASNGSASLPPSAPGSLPRTSTLERSIPGSLASLARQETSDAQFSTLYSQPGRPGDAVDDVTRHALARLPECRWKHPVTVRLRSSRDQFFTLKRAENFTVCSDCYGELFANSEFQHLFVPAIFRSRDQIMTCDFGSSPWYRIAYILTLTHRYPDLRLLQGIASVAARSQPCAGGQLASRIWYSMMAPNSRRPIQTFNVCFSCAKMVEVLLPNLAGVFVPLGSHEPTRGVCELYFAPDRKRFYDYFDEMKATSALALSRRTAPDLIELVDRIRDISLHEECLRNTPIPNRKWHVLERVPEFTVCEECFNTVVWPMIEDEENGSELPRNFYKYKQTKPVASCQLYSDRMRRVFLEACQHDDFKFLASCVLHRMRVMAQVKARYNELQREDQEDPKVQDELRALAKELREVE
ncbi:hypothetical protein N657DRAFT_566909 [Parathielavia appendiculata]|uniref:Uncharacterized protein n=1 Tax=Parathielavia appendiculata TaxID=2587402 RepID=A0AAN6U7R5_9PEZI|nr:hypothetical protein N657DRAFT_566909 [Parathielavia appendiculata]